MKTHPLPSVFLSAALALPAGAFAQGFVFSKIVDNNDPIPGRAGALFQVGDQPALDADGRVVFRQGPGSLSPDSIWTATPGGEAPVRLVDFSTPVPGGVGNFSAFIVDFSNPGVPAINGGQVVFAGRDSNSAALNGFNAGLYSLPAAGGSVQRVVNYQTPSPSSGSNFFGDLARFSLDAGRVAFHGVSPLPNSGSIEGVYAVNLDGSALTALADANHPAGRVNIFDVNLFNLPSISGGQVLLYGQTVFDPSTGFGGLFTTPATGSFAYTTIANSDQPLPGDANGSFHTRFSNLQLNGSTALFLADDANTNPNFFGLFTVDAGGGGAFRKVVTVNDALPGLGKINLNAFREFSLRDGLVAFTAQDDPGKLGLYLSNADGTGAPARIFATGDPGPFADTGGSLGDINGRPLSLGPNAVNRGRIVFRAYGGLYLATPAANAADVRANLARSPGGPASVGTTLSYTLTVSNAGPAPAEGVRVSLTLPAGMTFLSAPNGGSADGAGVVQFPAPGTLAAGQTVSYAVNARVGVPGVQTVGAFAAGSTPDPDRANNHAQDVLAPPAASGDYVFTRIVGTGTPVPDRPGEVFAIPGGNGPLAAVDGGRVAFVANDADNRSVVWVADVNGGGLTRIADQNTPMPGGEGDVFGNIFNLRLRGGTVAFVGFGTGQHNGIFSAPATGGAVSAVVRQGSPRPENPAVAFDYQGFNQSFALGYLNDGRVGFVAQGGVYSYPATGGGDPRVLVYPGSAIAVADNRSSTLFGAPAVSGTRSVFQGSNSELLGTFLDERRFIAFADRTTPVPGGGGNFIVGNGDNFANPQIEGDTTVFVGASGTSPAFVRGIYSVTGGRLGAPVTKLVDTNTPVPGGSGNFAALTAAGGAPEVVALNAGEVVFGAVDAAGRAGLYSVPAAGGTVTKIIATGDSLGGSLTLTGFSQPTIQANSLGGHQVVFRGDFLDASTNRGGVGIFVASQGSATAHPPFFAGEAALGNGVYYLAFPNGNPFGYYSYLPDSNYIFHQDLGYEYVFDANDGRSGVYLYDFASNGFFYTSPGFPFPYLYDFSLNTVLYYYPDPNNPGRYNTNGTRFFFRFDTGQIFSK